ncbi:MAG: TRAP transporter small permease [Alphaproteobacteria bacterium]|nr:TRAP transporter small permease [Alphaproteobacteria bacterium]
MLTYEVIVRYFFAAPTSWAAELSQMALIWGSLIAMPWILAARRHITVTAITAKLSARNKRLADGAAMIVVLVFSLIVTIWGWDIFHDSFVRGRTTGSLLNLPVWIIELAVPVGFGLLAIQAGLEVLGLARSRASPRDRPTE